MDALKNFAVSLVATAPSPATSGTSLVVTAATGTLFPATPFYATVWPPNVQPTAANAEIVRVTTVSTDTFTITRTQDGSTNQSIAVGWNIEQGVTAGLLNQLASIASPTFTGTTTAPEFSASGLTGATAASRYVGATASGAPASGTFAVGDFIIDQTGFVYVCTVAGTPGTWVKVGGSSALTYGGATLGANVTLPTSTNTTIQTTASLPIGTYLINASYLLQNSGTITTPGTAQVSLLLGSATATFVGVPVSANGFVGLVNSSTDLVMFTISCIVVVTVAGTLKFECENSSFVALVASYNGGVGYGPSLGYSYVKIA